MVVEEPLESRDLEGFTRKQLKQTKDCVEFVALQKKLNLICETGHLVLDSVDQVRSRTTQALLIIENVSLKIMLSDVESTKTFQNRKDLGVAFMIPSNLEKRNILTR